MNDSKEQVVNAGSVHKLTLQLQCAVQFEESVRAVADSEESTPFQRVLAKASLDLNHVGRGVLRGIIDVHNELAATPDDAVNLEALRQRISMLANTVFGYYQDSLAPYVVEFDLDNQALLIGMTRPEEMQQPQQPDQQVQLGGDNELN